MRKTIDVHTCDRCGGDFKSQRDVALTVHTARSCIGGGYATSARQEFCARCAQEFDAFLTWPHQTEQHV